MFNYALKFIFMAFIASCKISLAAEYNKSALGERLKFNCDPKLENVVVIKSICYSFLNNFMSEELLLPDPNKLEELDFNFEGKVDLNKDGDLEYLRVGYFVEQEKYGRFLMIAADPAFKKIIKVFHRYDEDVFSAISIKDSEVSWYFCLNCADKEQLVFSNGGYFLE